MDPSKPTDASKGRSELTITDRLLVMAMVRNGLTQRTIAAGIGVSESTLSRMFPKGLLKSIAPAE